MRPASTSVRENTSSWPVSSSSAPSSFGGLAAALRFSSSSGDICMASLRRRKTRPGSAVPGLFRRQLVRGLGLEVAGLVALRKLARGVAERAVHHPAALDRRPRGDLVGPALDVLVVAYRQELAAAIEHALGHRP